MKLRTLLLATILAPMCLNAQQTQVIDENFTNGISEGWYIYSGLGATWTLNDTIGVDGSKAIWARSENEGEAWIRTIPVNLEQMTEHKIEFTVALIGYKDSVAPDLLLKYRTDSQDPTEWLDVTSWGGSEAENSIEQSSNDNGILNESNIEWVEIAYDLSDIVGELDSVRLWLGASFTEGGWVVLDDIRVLGTPFTTGVTTIKSNELRVWPNPTYGAILIQSSNAIDHIEVYNALGQKVLSQYYYTVSEKQTLNISSLPKGTYVIMSCNLKGETQASTVVHF